MILKTFLYFITPLLLIGCGAAKKSVVNYNKNIIKAQECVNNYYFYNSSKSLDSAFFYLSKVENGYCADSNRLVKLHMSTVYFLKEDFKEAIKIYESMDDSKFSFPEYKRVIINKIKAKDVGTKKKYDKQKKYYSAIIADLDLFLNRNIFIRDSILRLSNMSSLNRLEQEVLFMISQKYYYLNKLKGTGAVVAELDSLQQISDGDANYFELLKKSTTGIDGYHMSVDFE